MKTTMCGGGCGKEAVCFGVGDDKYYCEECNHGAHIINRQAIKTLKDDIKRKNKEDNLDFMIVFGDNEHIHKIVFLDAGSHQEIEEKTKDYLFEWFGVDGEVKTDISDIWVAEYPRKINPSAWYDERSVEIELKKKQKLIDEELQELKRLKEKYEQ